MGQRRPWLVLQCQGPQHQAAAMQKGSASRLKGAAVTEEPWAGVLGGQAGSRASSVVCLLFDVLKGNRQLCTRGLVRRGCVHVLFLHAHSDDCRGRAWEAGRERRDCMELWEGQGLRIWGGGFASHGRGRPEEVGRRRGPGRTPARQERLGSVRIWGWASGSPAGPGV